MATTFISYRRDDSAGYAGRLHEALERRLGSDRIFRDVDTLRPGEDFIRAITDRVRQCRVFLVLIGQEWLAARDASGRRRLELDEDYVRLEIESALNRDDRLVVPVLIEGATMPTARDLPESIRKLAYRHAISLRDETWDADVDRLAALIAENEPAEAALPPADRRLVHTRSSGMSLPWIASIAAVVMIAVVLGLMRLTRDDTGAESSDTVPSASGAAETPDRDASPAPAPARDRAAAAYAIRIPRVAEVAHGPFLFTLLAGSVAPHGAANELRLRFRVSNEGFYPANLSDGSFRLAVAERVLTATSGLNEIVAGRSIDEAIVTFDFPPEASRATLRILAPESVGELPLDLTSTGRAAEDERAPAGDALSPAILFSLQRDPAPLVDETRLAVTLQSASGRRFANVVRLRLSVRIANNGPYPRASGDLVMRAAVADRLVAPIEQPNEVIAPASDMRGTYVFDVPPDARRVVVRVMLGGAMRELPFDLPG